MSLYYSHFREIGLKDEKELFKLKLIQYYGASNDFLWPSRSSVKRLVSVS